MSHSSSVFVCSFAIVEDGQNYLSSSGMLLIERATNSFRQTPSYDLKTKKTNTF